MTTYNPRTTQHPSFFFLHRCCCGWNEKCLSQADVFEYVVVSTWWNTWERLWAWLKDFLSPPTCLLDTSFCRWHVITLCPDWQAGNTPLWLRAPLHHGPCPSGRPSQNKWISFFSKLLSVSAFSYSNRKAINTHTVCFHKTIQSYAAWPQWNCIIN